MAYLFCFSNKVPPSFSCFFFLMKEYFTCCYFFVRPKLYTVHHLNSARRPYMASTRRHSPVMGIISIFLMNRGRTRRGTVQRH